MRTVYLIYFLLKGASLIAQISQVTGTIQTANLKPIANVRVEIRPAVAKFENLRQPAITKGPVGNFRTGADGKFSIATAAGTYFLCVVPGVSDDLIDPCIWDMDVTSFQTAGGKALNLGPITMKAGYRFNLRFDHDPALASNTALQQQLDRFSPSFWTANGFAHHSFQVASDKSGREHSVVLPYGVKFNLAFHNPYLDIRDGKGVPIEYGTTRFSIEVAGNGLSPAKIQDFAGGNDAIIYVPTSTGSQLVHFGISGLKKAP